MIFAKFLFFTKSRRSVQTGVKLESDTKIDSVLSAVVEIDFGRSITQRSPSLEDFLEG